MRKRITYADVVSSLALFLVLAGGAAYALDGSNTVFTDDIVDAQVKAADVAQGAVATDELANGQVKNADIGAGEVRSGNVANDNLTGGDIAPNSLRGGDINEGTLDIGDAARAYGTVVPIRCGSPSPAACPVEQSKGISEVIRTGLGSYCITAPGIDPDTTTAAVTVEWAGTSPGREGLMSAMLSRGSSGCSLATGTDSFHVRTAAPEFEHVVNIQGDTVRVAADTTVGSNQVAFTIVIP